MALRDEVLAAYRNGATTRREIAAITGHDIDLVELTVDILLRDGTIDVPAFRPACVSNGCGTCAETTTCTPTRGGAVPVTIRR